MITAVGTLPDTFIVGAPKSGTTYLASWLGHSPDVFVPTVKEPGFFMEESHYRRGLADYSTRYYEAAGNEAVVVDATPWYLYPASVPLRVAESIGTEQARIIVVLRNPVSRAVSMYYDQAGRRRELRRIEDAFADELAVADPDAAVAAEMSEATVRHYLLCGRYADPVRRWIDTFGRRSVCVLLAEELWGNPESVRHTLEGFLGVPVPPAPARVANPASRARFGFIESVLARAERTQSPVRSGVAAMPGIAGRLRSGLEAVARWNQVPARYTELDPDLRETLGRWYEPANRILEEVIERGLDEWR